MDPNQSPAQPPTSSSSPEWLKVLITSSIIVIIFIIIGLFVFKPIKNRNQAKMDDGASSLMDIKEATTTDVSAVATSTASTTETSVPEKKETADTVQKIVESKSPSYTIKKIQDLSKGVFEMPDFPNVKFKVTSITRVEGLEEDGCAGNYPAEVEKIIQFAGCTSFGHDGDYSVVGVDIKVENNSTGSVTGDIVTFGYFIQDGGETKLRNVDMGAINFSSYSFAPFSERTAKLHFWIPKYVKEVYMFYGKNIKSYNPYTTNTSVNVSGSGKLIIDFTKSAIIASGSQQPSTASQTITDTAMRDSEVKGLLSGVRAVAEYYYYQNNSFGITTNSCSVGMFADQLLVNYMQKMLLANMLTCRSNGNSYAVTSILPEAGGWWCIDSGGNSHATTVNLSQGVTYCSG